MPLADPSASGPSTAGLMGRAKRRSALWTPPWSRRMRNSGRGSESQANEQELGERDEGTGEVVKKCARRNDRLSCRQTRSLARRGAQFERGRELRRADGDRIGGVAFGGRKVSCGRRSETDPLTRLAPAGESAGGDPPSPPRGRRKGVVVGLNAHQRPACWGGAAGSDLPATPAVGQAEHLAQGLS